FLLAGEIRVEELRPRHAETALQNLAYSRDGVRYRLRTSVEVQLRHREAAHDAVAVAAELEVELDAHRRARRGAREANGILSAPSGVAAVECPCHGFEDRRFSGAVRA